MTMTTYTLDDVGGRLPVRSLAHFVRHLPPESATMRELSPEDGERLMWMRGMATAQLVAILINEVRGMQWIYSKAHSNGSVRRPQPFPTPWATPEETGVRRIGSDPITIAEFDEWFDRKE